MGEVALTYRWYTWSISIHLHKHPPQAHVMSDVEYF